MPKHFRLAIDEPCHEAWDRMTPAQQGRHCASCQKNVVDFTNMSDTQLAEFFKNRRSDVVCGRFYNDQLQREINIPNKGLPWIKYFFHIALPALLMSAKAAAQRKLPVQMESRILHPVMGNITAIEPGVNRNDAGNTTPMQLRGVVVGEQGSPVPFASIMLKGTTIGTSADSTGTFVLNIPRQDSSVLEFSSVGFETREVKIERKDAGNLLHVKLTIKQNENEVVVVGYGIRMGAVAVMGAVTRVSDCTMEITSDIKQDSTSLEKDNPSMIKVYPNPVAPGTSINIGCNKLEEGYYSLRLFNQGGQQIQEKQVWVDAEAVIINMEVPNVARGHYVLVMVHKETNRRYSEKILVQ